MRAKDEARMQSILDAAESGGAAAQERAARTHPGNPLLAEIQPTCKVLVVDDDAGVRGLVVRRLSHAGFHAVGVDGPESAMQMLTQEPWNVMVTDLRMPGGSGIDLMKLVANAGIDTVPIIMSGYGDVHSAVEAIKQGAFDFVEKPHDLPRLADAVQRAFQHQRLQQFATTMAETASEWEATFNAVPDIIAVVNAEGRAVRINQAFANRLGCAPDSAIGTCFDDLLPGAESIPMEWDPRRETENPNDRFSALYARVLGGDFLVTITPVFGYQGRLMGYVHVARDVTRLKQTEERLRTAHAETQNLLGSLSYFVVGLDLEGHVTQWNTAAEQTFGRAHAEVLGQRVHDCNLPWDWAMVSSAMAQFESEQSTSRLTEIPYTRPDGNQGLLEITINAMWCAPGRPKGMVMLGTDITARKNLEAQLIHAQKLESIGQLASGIAHEINTPIQYVGDNIRFIHDAFSDIGKIHAAMSDLVATARDAGFALEKVAAIEEQVKVLDFAYLTEEVPKATRESLDGVERVAGILRAMKEFSHPGTVEKTLVDLNRAIESTITVARNEWKYVADVETHFDADLPLVACLPGEFNQVILNVLINAVHAIRDVVNEGTMAKGVIGVTTKAVGDSVEIRISDTGCGIPEKVRNRIFDPFFTTKAVGRGTGQGLAIAHNVIVEKHQGLLTFETEQGKGTTFIIRLPVGG